jgi:VanZ family protein
VSGLREFSRPRLWLGLWCFGWLLCIVLSMIANPPIPADVPDGDKIGHFLAYALLAAWAVWIFRGQRSQWRAALALCLLGVVIEVMQGTLTTYRSMDWHDALADFFGVAAGLWLSRRAPGTLQRLDRRVFARAAG